MTEPDSPAVKQSDLNEKVTESVYCLCVCELYYLSHQGASPMVHQSLPSDTKQRGESASVETQVRSNRLAED